MGVIYRGVDTILDREVAIKVMSPDFADSTDEARSRFFREARAAAKLQHRNIVTVFEFAEQDGIPYIVMEFLRGRSLSARLSSGPPLTLDQKLDVMTELCNGLQFAHEHGVIHRDVKPGNVWILEDGAVKLVDFGIAKIASTGLTLRGTDVMGSASYMSPEQIEGLPVTGRSDVFSATVVLYELVGGRRPFEGDSPTATMMQIVQGTPPPIETLVPDLPHELVEVITKGLEKDPENRFHTAADLAAELQLIRMSLPVPREEPTQLVRRPEPVTSGNLEFKAAPLPVLHDRSAGTAKLAMWIGAAAVVLAVVVGFVVWNRGPAPPPQQTPVAKPPNPEPEPPKVWTVTVDSKPPGASIFVDDVDTGRRTPGAVQIATGAAVRLERRNAKPFEVRPTEDDLKRGTLTYELPVIEPADVQVLISASYPVEVWEGGRRLKEAAESHSVSLPDGRTLTLKSDTHFLSRNYKVDARGGRTFRISAPELGYQTLSGPSEQCAVVIDGRRTNHYLRQALPPIAAGRYVFTFVCSDGRSLPRTVIDIEPGQNPVRQIR